MKLIDKDALVAEIERRIKTNKECMLGLKNLDYYQGKVDALKSILSFLNTLEVKEVNDEPECRIFPRPIECYSTCKECPFRTINNKAQKGEEV